MKLLIFTACEKVIEDLTQGSSLISIFHGIKIQIPENQELPTNVVVPKDWAAFSKWELDQGEEGGEYTSRIQIIWPDGSEFARHELPATQPTKDGMAFVHRLNGFPFGQNGRLLLLQSLLCDGEVIFGPVEFAIKVEVAKVLPPVSLEQLG